MANPVKQTWSKVCLIGMWDGTTYMHLTSYVTYSELINLGDRPVEMVPNCADGRIAVEKPEEDTEINFDARFVGAGDKDATSPDGLLGMFYDGTVATQPISVDNYLAAALRKTYNLWFLWSDDSTVSAGTGAIVSGANALRCRVVSAFLESCKQNWSDGELKWTCKFRVPARTRTGAKTITWESTDGTASMASLGTLTST